MSEHTHQGFSWTTPQGKQDDDITQGDKVLTSTHPNETTVRRFGIWIYNTVINDNLFSTCNLEILANDSTKPHN